MGADIFGLKDDLNYEAITYNNNDEDFIDYNSALDIDVNINSMDNV